VYFSSFAMLQDLSPRMVLLGRRLLLQRPGMSEDDRKALLQNLVRPDDSDRPTVLCAVLGGLFAEGIDLPPGALDAVAIVGPALPPVGLERRLLRESFDERYGQGHRYASLVPGLTKVVQAAGRLVRRADDRGVVLLVGRRFRWRDVQAELPKDWSLEVPEEPAQAVRAFFRAHD
jgi:DNA excision repair protein ERCC-2